MKAPFPWFGGKRRVADVVWAALGNPDNYVEPFAGSLAVLLERPPDDGTGKARTETVNDADGYIANFWRAVAVTPDLVAKWADEPVNETDLIAKHMWLTTTGRTILLNNLEANPEWSDPKIAGWWVWGICSWIGSGWCSGQGPWSVIDGIVDRHGTPDDIGGVQRNRPHLGDAGQGINRACNNGIGNYMDALSDRLRPVRVCAGDWSRVVTTGALTYGATVGVFLDPPYSGNVRDNDLYAVDDHTISQAVRDWALANGDNPRLRIVLAGYAPEHDHLIPDTWHRHNWTAGSAYGTAASAARQDGNHSNRHTEVLWMSPHCLTATTDDQLDLFNQSHPDD